MISRSAQFGFSIVILFLFMMSPDSLAGSLGKNNIAQGKTIIPHSSVQRGSPPEAVDGSAFTLWYSFFGVDDNDCSNCIAFTLDLEEKHPIQTIVVVPAQTWNIKISSSLDGNSWTERYSNSWTGAIGGAIRIDFATAFEARYLKYEGSAEWFQWVGVVEFEVYETMPLPPVAEYGEDNLALTAAISQDWYGAIQPPENALDGDINTDWIPAGKNDNDATSNWQTYGYIEIDLGENYNLGKIVLRPKRFQYFSAYAYKDALNPTGENWSFISHPDLFSGGQTTSETGFIFFDNVEARYLRFYVLNLEVAETTTPVISEIEIYPMEDNSGVFLPPVPGQTWTRTIRVDSNGNGRPDEGDETVQVIQESTSMNYLTLVSERWGSTIVELADPNPQTGQFQQVIHQRPQSAVAAALGRPIPQKRQGSDRNETTVVTIDSLDATFRPASFSLRQTKVKNGVTTVRTGSGGAEDTNGDGAPDQFGGSGTDTPKVSMSLVYSDVNNDGNADYASIPWAMAELIGVNLQDATHDPQVWIPLGDTDGDGKPDSPGFDFNRDNAPDATLPLPPVVTGTPLANSEYRMHFAQLADGIGGDAQFVSQIYLFNLDTQGSAQAEVTVRRQNGTFFPLKINGQNFSGNQIYPIQPGGLKILTTGGTTPLEVGSVAVKSDRPLAGVTAYAAPGFGAAGVGSSPQVGTGFISPIQRNQAQRVDTGMALMNLEDREISFTPEIFDTEGDYVGKAASVSIPAHGQTALMLGGFNWEFPMNALDEFDGLLKVNATGEVAATVIQTRPGEYATQPVVPNLNPKSVVSSQPLMRSYRADDSDLDHKLHFAQFVNGSIGDLFIRSKIYLFNQDTTGPATAKVLIRGDNGGFLSLDINGEPVDGQVEMIIPTNGVRIIEPQGGEGKITTGSVTVKSDKLVSGTLLFTSTLGTAGVGNSTELTQGFVAPMLTSQAQKIDTGIAVMNPGETGASLQIGLYDLDGNRLAQSQLVVPPLGHKALLIKEFSWNPQQNLNNFSGLMKVTTDNHPIAATIIQTRPNQYLTMPVAPKLN